MKPSKVLAGLMGLCVGDALGVPVEFSTREERTQDPVVDMNGQNSWHELPGTWSETLFDRIPENQFLPW